MRVPKTSKLFVNGAFPRTESGRSYPLMEKDGTLYANLCDATRKDLRTAVDAARAAQSGWSARAAYNRGQILYRVGELLSSRAGEFAECLSVVWGMKETDAAREAQSAMDAFVYFAGFTDKFQQLVGAVNPVSGPHHNFTSPEPVGVVAFWPSEASGFAHFAGQLAAILAAGNTVIARMPGKLGALLAPFAEVLATSDLPGGVVNLLTEKNDELFALAAQHMEIQAFCVGDGALLAKTRELGVANLKRVAVARAEVGQLASLLDFVEHKTVWHPIGV